MKVSIDPIDSFFEGLSFEGTLVQLIRDNFALISGFSGHRGRFLARFAVPYLGRKASLEGADWTDGNLSLSLIG